jgi:hypothetical protein
VRAAGEKWRVMVKRKGGVRLEKVKRIITVYLGI